MIASENRHVDLVNVLLQHGASVHLQNKVVVHLLTFLFISPHNYVCIAVYFPVVRNCVRFYCVGEGNI